MEHEDETIRDQLDDETILWRCRACSTLNDFVGIESWLDRTDLDLVDAGRDFNQHECRFEDGLVQQFKLLATYECCACGFSIEPRSDWFIAQPDRPLMFIETGFEPVAVEPRRCQLNVHNVELL